MRDFLHQVFARLLIPAVLGTTWLSAHYQSVASGHITTTWIERGVERTGNPYTAALHPIAYPKFDDDNGDRAEPGTLPNAFDADMLNPAVP